jgi:PAS domain S-box-containing protein
MFMKTKTQLIAELETAQKQIEKLEHALKKQTSAKDRGQEQEKLARLLEILPVGISILDADRKVVYENPALQQMLDLSSEELRTGAYKNRKYLSPDGSPMPSDRFASTQARKNGKPIYNVETGIVKENGETIWANVSAIPVDFPDWKTVIVTTDVTERKNAEDIVHSQQHNLEALIENTDGSIWSVDAHYRLIVGNTLYHQNVSAALGRRLLTEESVLLSTFPQPALDEWRGYYDRALRGERFSVEAQTRFSHPPHFVEYRFNPIVNVAGEITGVTVFGRDITECKQAEKALHISLTKYKTLFESFPLGITISGPAGDILETNAIAEKLLGISQEEHTKRKVDGAEWRIIRPDGIPMPAEEYASVRALKENRKVDNVEMGIVKPDDSVTWINVTAAPLPLEEYGVVITYQDITERKKTEEALQESETRFRALFYNVPMSGVVYRLIRDAQNEIIDWEIQEINKPGAADIGQTPSELIGKRADALFGMETMKPYLELCRCVLASNQPEQFETHFSHNNKYYLSSVFAVGSNHYANISIDVTERKHMEEELRRSNAELEQFAYIASHDLQEPLRTLAGMVQLLQKRYQGQLDERADEYISHAVESASRMQALIRDLLAYSRVDRRNQPVEAVSAQDCLQIALKNLGASIRESGAVLVAEDLPIVHADSTQLVQLFQNLIGNSIKFRGERESHVQITATQLNDVWQFAVSDNGIGIEAQYFDRIFLVFQRLHTRRQYQGTGIGLALCKKIVERHGGSIWVESRPGEGSTFYFTLPI